MPFDWRTESERRRAERAAYDRDRQAERDESNRKTAAPRLRGRPAVIEDDDMDAGTGTSTPADAPIGSRAITTTSAGRGGRTDGAETAVDPIGEVKLRPFHETQDTLLPFYGLSRDVPVQASVETGVVKYTFRLNSPYDVVNVQSYTADPTPAADTADATIQKTQMYDYWASIYRYWHVTKATYEVTFWTPTKSDTGGMTIWCYHHGQQEPPLLSTANTRVPDYMRQLHKHCHQKVLYCRGPSLTTSEHERKTAVTFTGEYMPGQKSVHNDVSEDEYQETWHRVNEVPSLREVVSFIVQKNDSCPMEDMVVHVEYKLFYHVQWKDQQVIYQYPTQLSDTVAVVDYADRDI